MNKNFTFSFLSSWLFDLNMSLNLLRKEFLV